MLNLEHLCLDPALWQKHLGPLLTLVLESPQGASVSRKDLEKLHIKTDV